MAGGTCHGARENGGRSLGICRRGLSISCEWEWEWALKTGEVEKVRQTLMRWGMGLVPQGVGE